MKNKLLFLSVALLLLAAACNKGGNKGSAGQESNSNQTKNQTAKQGQGSFKELMASGQPQKCDSSFSSQGNTSTGTIYVAAGQMRGDFSTEVQGKTMQSHMIVKDQTVYNWVEG